MLDQTTRRTPGAARASDIARLAARAVKRVDAARDRQLRLVFRLIGCDEEEAAVRARVFYYHQIGYYALGVREPRSLRKRLLPTYLRILIGAEHLDRPA